MRSSAARIVPGRSSQGKCPARPRISTRAEAPIARAVLGGRGDGHRAARSVQEDRGHRDPRDALGQARELAVKRFERAGVGLDRRAEARKRRRSRGVGEVGRPEQPHRLHLVALAAAARDRLELELLGARDVLGRHTADHLRVELRLAAVADAPERVDDQRGSHSLWMIGEHVQQQVPAPGVTGDECALPPQRIENRNHIGHLHGHVVGSTRRRGRQAALLIGGDAVGVGELVHDGLQVVPRQSGPAVQQEHRWPVACEQAVQLPALHLDLERLAHGRTTQRKPMWLMPESIICGRRAAGR